MKLNYIKLGENNEKNLVILHGLFGSLDNWITLGKAFSNHFNVYLVDQRNHGKSQHLDEFDYQVMADDLKEFLDENAIKKPILLGHSMGGKTVMQFAIENPDFSEKIIIVDIAPKKYAVHHYEIIEALKSINLKLISKREEADEFLKKSIPQIDIRQFLLKNLTRNNEGNFAWKMNLNAIEKNIEIIGEGLQGNNFFSGKALFIRGLKSNYILNSDEELIKSFFPNSELFSVQNAGHWVHAEAPEILFKKVLEFSFD